MFCAWLQFCSMNLYIGIRVFRPTAKTGSRPAIPLSETISDEFFDILDTNEKQRGTDVISITEV